MKNSLYKRKNCKVVKVEDTTFNKNKNKKVVISKKENTTKKEIDIDKLAFAVAMQETKNCQLWFWKTYNNCFWIKNWSVAPCKKIGRKNMCIYNSPAESYVAFRKIWTKVYGWVFPDYRKARLWSGNDRASEWLKNVNYFYNYK